MHRYPFTDADHREPMPVLPDVFSTIVAAGLQRARLLGLLDHVQRHAVFHRPARVHELELHVDGRVVRPDQLSTA